MGHPKEYNVNKDNKLSVGDKLQDSAGNKYVVTALKYNNPSHSQYASEVLVECVKGKHEGRKVWVDHYLASQYKKAGKASSSEAALL